MLEFRYTELKRYLENDYHKAVGMEYSPDDLTWVFPCGAIVNEQDMIAFCYDCFDMEDVFEIVDRNIKESIKRSKE